MIWNFELLRDIMYISVAQYMKKKHSKDVLISVLYLAKIDTLKL